MLDKLKATTKNSVIYGFGNMAGKLSGIILLPLYTKYLSIEEFGLIALYEVIFQLLSILGTFGMKSSLMRYYWDKEYKDHARESVFNTFLVVVVLSILSLVLSGIILNTFSQLIFDTRVSLELNIVFIVSTFIRVIADFILMLLRIQHKAAKQTRFQLISLVLTVGLTWVFIKYFGLDLVGIFLALGISNLIITFLLFPYLARNLLAKLNLAFIKEFFRYGSPLSLASLLTIILVLSDRFILNHFMDLGVVGNYSLAYKITNIIHVIVVTSFMNSYVHVFYREMDKEDSGRFYSKILTYFSFVIIFMSMLIVVFSSEVIKVLAQTNADYWDSIQLIPYLIIGVIIAGIRQIVVLPLTKDKRTKVISAVTIAASFLNLGLNFLLIPRFSAIGAALSTNFAQLFALVYLYAASRKGSIIHYEIGKIIKCFSVALALTSLSYFINDMDLGWRLTLKALLVVSYFLILYWWNFFEKVELESIYGFWKKWSKISRLRENLKNEM
jgi:O-antigen/teichoic acid export membrane protein